jgi:hypothetical protein
LANNWLLHLEDIRHVHAHLLNAIRTEGRSQQACARANRETQGEHPREVKHPFRVIKRLFGLLKVRFRGLATNTAHVITLFALSNLWMVRRRLLATTGALRPQFAKWGNDAAWNSRWLVQTFPKEPGHSHAYLW